MTVGDPMDEDTNMEPQAPADLMAELHNQVKASVEMAARIELGGEPLDRESAYYLPTVLSDVC